MKLPENLDEVFVRGDTPDPDRLAGWEYRGMNTPAYTKLLGIRHFVKGFYKDGSGQLYGYNMPPEGERRYGFYRVDRVDPEARDNAHLHALLLDYGRGGGSRLDPTTRLRDYLVRVERGSDDLLVGKAYIAVGPARLPVSMFLLEKLRPSSMPAMSAGFRR